MTVVRSNTRKSVITFGEGYAVARDEAILKKQNKNKKQL
jgi:hypothetical protein